MSDSLSAARELIVDSDSGMPIVPQQSWSAYTKSLNTVFSLRGLILGVICLILWLGPGRNQADVIATTISTLILCAVIGCAAVTAIIGRHLRKKLSIELLSQPGQNTNLPFSVVAGEDVTLVTRINQFSLPPLLCLEVQLESEFGHTFTRHQLTGSTDYPRTLSEQTTFPHRGYWRIDFATFRLTDLFGLSFFTWNLPLSTAMEVQPGILRNLELPILSSTQRSGDMVVDTQRRDGDPFDLKAYHPSDGMKKILWKVYAKSGELISRHPEASMTPEGKVAVFCLAGRYDEAVCAYCMGYLERLQEMNLEIYFGCAGMADAKAATSLDSAKNLLMQSVWTSDTSLRQNIDLEIEHFINQLATSKTGSDLNKIVFMLQIDLPAKYLETLEEKLHNLYERGIQPTLFVVTEESLRVADQSSFGWFQRLPFGHWLFDMPIARNTKESHNILELLTRAGQQGWQIVRI